MLYENYNYKNFSRLKFIRPRQKDENTGIYKF